MVQDIEEAMFTYFLTSIITKRHNDINDEAHLISPSLQSRKLKDPIAFDDEISRYRHIQLVDVNFRSLLSVRDFPYLELRHLRLKLRIQIV